MESSLFGSNRQDARLHESRHASSGHLASRTVRGYVSVVVGHQFAVLRYSSPRKQIHLVP